ncbi:MAG: hypothetical protein VX346_00395, partial [Planctomycetota bacterium]|nr:hypothetical protein [Planctomycetota bacterium]
MARMQDYSAARSSGQALGTAANLAACVVVESSASGCLQPDTDLAGILSPLLGPPPRRRKGNDHPRGGDRLEMRGLLIRVERFHALTPVGAARTMRTGPFSRVLSGIRFCRTSRPVKTRNV